MPNTDTGVQLDTSPIANGYRELCWAIIIFALNVVWLTTKAILCVDISTCTPIISLKYPVQYSLQKLNQ